MNTQYTNFRLILDKITRHPLMQDITSETVIDYIIDFMRIVGNPTMFIEKTALIDIATYRGAIPADFHTMIQVRSAENQSCAYRYSTDNFHYSENNVSSIDPTYKIQGGIIYTSTEDIPIEIAYNAIATDDCGFPLLPDNSSFTRALELYVKKQWFTILFDLGKISPAVLQNTQQEYAWAVGDCQSEFNRLSIDEMESLCNSWRTLLMRTTEHSTGFKHNGTRELLKNH